ncbi:hypothetical protein DOY81_002310 [Sarcophaga bullata]|nr:hypothetical protein DOY81_002310 [Sarcophaga bullata]
MATNTANEENKVYNHYLELSKPTEEDFQRIFSDEELKELCLKHKCRVDMWRWNVVNDYRILFTNSGRYQRWSDRKRVLMLAKAVNKMKPSVLYDEEDIKRIRKEEWGLQLKENIMSLNYWKRKKLNEFQERLLFVSDSEEIDQEILQQCAVNTESMNMADIYTQSQAAACDVNTESMNMADIYTQSQAAACAVNTESMNMANTYIQSQAAAPSEEAAIRITPPTEKLPTPALRTQSEECNILMDVMQEDEYLIDEDSEDSTDTVAFTGHQPQQKAAVAIIVEPAETLQSEEVAPEIENIYGVNTMSMTIDSQLSTQSSLGMPLAQSQDVIPQNYDNFKNIIPLTSTQSQSHESEEIQVA